jgi:hypothetical protein
MDHRRSQRADHHAQQRHGLPDEPAPGRRPLTRGIIASSNTAVEPIFCKLAIASAAPAQAGPWPTDLSLRSFPEPLLAHAIPVLGPAIAQARFAEHDYPRTIGARAVTWREQILFAPGELDLASDHGRELIFHELAHVRQGSAAVTPAADGSLPIDRDAGRERDADDAAERILSGRGGGGGGGAPGRGGV